MTRRSVGVLAAALVVVLSGTVGYSTTSGSPAAAAQTDPAANLTLPQSLLDTQYTDCRIEPIDNSVGCTEALLAEINYGLATEGLAPMALPSNWYSLSVPEQTFVVVDLERVARGLQPFRGLSFIWDAVAQTGAESYQDPPTPQGYAWEGTEWAGGVANPLQADFVWMYNDGFGSPNIDCPSAGAPGCWIHRNNMLAVGSCTTCLVGAGYATVDGFASVAAVFVEPNGAAPPLAFTWANNVAPFLGRPQPTEPPVSGSSRPATGGYREVAADGGIFAMGAPYYGSMGGTPLAAPVVGMAVDPWTAGYWEVASDGGVFAFNAPFYGSMGGRRLDAPIVGIVTDPATGGYWEVAADGGVFAFNAPFYGSMGGQRLDARIVGMALDPWTGGYWEVAADGGVFAFNAPFFGSMGGQPLSARVVGIAADPGKFGYWEVAADGGVFAFRASFFGSMGGQPLSAPVVGMALDPWTGGYWEVAADGGVFTFNAPFYGSEGGVALQAPVAGIAL